MLNKDNLKNGCKAIGSFVKDVVVLVGPFVAAKCLIGGSSCKHSTIGTYGDAVNAIVDSSMFSEDKAKAVSALQRGMESGFYEAVIGIANSSMFSNQKCETILNMCNVKESE